MIKRLIGIFLVVLLGGLLGALIRYSPGYVLIAFGGSSIETSLWVAILILVLSYMALGFTFRLFSFLFSVPGDIRGWLRRRSEIQKNKIMLEGLLASMSGRWKDARHYLSKASQESEAPLLIYMNAAEAAQGLGYEDEYESLLKQAEATGKEGLVLAALSRSEIFLIKGDRASAIEHLNKAVEIAPKHPRIARLKKLISIVR